jgi:hypothetical protein
MATNFFFNNFKASREQNLLDDLIVESIRIYGEDMIYVPRNYGNLDALYTADDDSYYMTNYSLEMYIKSVDGFSGDGSFMSKFGLEIRDQVIFSVAQRVFSNEVGSQTGFTRPREGDLIFFPLNNKVFQIKYVNKFEMFYQLGALQTWEMTCELFEYSNERMKTGIPAIDILQDRWSTNELDYAFVTDQGYFLQDDNGDFILQDDYNLGAIIGNEANEMLTDEGTKGDGLFDFTQVDPFSEGHF